MKLKKTMALPLLLTILVACNQETQKTLEQQEKRRYSDYQ